MTPAAFDKLYDVVGKLLVKKSLRQPIAAKCRLFLTLMYLAHGSSHFYLSRLFRMGVSTVRSITQEVTQIIWNKLCGIYLPEVDENSWKQYSNEFKIQWNLPNCCGAIDGKHITLECPPKSGSLYFNYKKQHSISLMAICDANYNFLAVDVGAYGGNSDGSVFAASEFGRRLLRDELNLPGPCALPRSEHIIPHYIVGDAAFPLKSNLMRPYPGRNLSLTKENFNRRLSRARRTIENAFGIMVARWRILKSPLIMHPMSAEHIVKSVVILHNFVKQHCGSQYAPRGFADIANEDGDVQEGEWRKLVEPMASVSAGIVQRGNNAARSAYDIRDLLAQYLLENKIP
ncbi:uncharacterized protein LOC131680974 [Topomyia yanbarensis]|uniref:uncharacterized protein LOC131680974 n=1 Tax=Topomyia yanbarensis TaxID=2498891 RepID=UPI00273AE2BF|nr:uncharacterized protein LOC131680974 [Topomyia yanbarensis]